MAKKVIVESLKQIDRRLFAPFVERLPHVLQTELGDCETLLDLGCGASSPVGELTPTFKFTVGADRFKQAIDRSKALGLHRAYLQLDVTRAREAFAPKSFDAVVALDLIEHLEKADGLELLDALETIARRKSIILTPNGFVRQEPFDGNEFQRHRSGWSVGEMTARGYRVIGINGWKPLRGEFAEVKWWPRRFWRRAAWLTQPWAEDRPQWAFHLLCVKSLAA
jgi:hypothetical protein